MQTLTELELNVLFACILLDKFDPPAIAILLATQSIEGDIAGIIHKLSFIYPIVGENGSYQLEAAASQELRQRLQQEYPNQYAILLERAILYYKTQMTNSGSDQHVAEAALMRHLDKLFFIWADGNEWDRLADLLTIIDATALQQVNHRHYLDYYQAVVAREQHNYIAAEQKLVDVRVKAEGDWLLQGRILTALGILYDQQGKFDNAIAAYAQSATIYQQLEDIIGEGKALNNQGIVYHELGQYEQAYNLFKQAYQLAQQADYTLLEEAVLLSLGYTAKATGRWREAVDYYQTGLTIAQRRGNQDMFARYHNNLGSVNFFTGNWHAAQQHYATALEIFLAPQYQDKREATDVYFNLGFLAFVQGQAIQAQSNYEQGRQLALEIGDLGAVSEFCYRLGDLQQKHGDAHQAYRDYGEALATIENLFGQASQETTRIGVMGVYQHVYQAMVLCCLTLGRVAEAFSYVQRAKSRAFLELLSRANAKGREYEQHPLPTGMIQAGLPTGTALIEFFATGHAGASEEMLAKLPTESKFLRHSLLPAEHLFAFIVTNDFIQVIELGITLQQIETRCFQRGNGRLRGTDAISDHPLPTLHWWHQLDTQLIAPIRPYLDGYRHLFVAPQGALHYLPIHALSISGQFLANHAVTVSYIPSASVLLQGDLITSTATTKRSPARLVADESLAIGVNLAGLTHSEAEAAWIGRQLQGTVLLGKAATIATVSSRLPSAHIIHFSCHGRFHYQRAMASALQLSDGIITAADILQSVRLRAAVVTLSACDTGLNYLTHGDELMGFTRAFLGAGARTVVMTLWKVIELPTRLLMEQFYTSLRAGATPATALQTAQYALRAIDETTLQQRVLSYGLSPQESNQQITQLRGMNPGKRPFDHPYYWGGFILVGAPE